MEDRHHFHSTQLKAYHRAGPLFQHLRFDHLVIFREGLTPTRYTQETAVDVGGKEMTSMTRSRSRAPRTQLSAGQPALRYPAEWGRPRWAKDQGGEIDGP